MYRPTLSILHASILLLWFLSAALSVVQAVSVPIRPAVPVHPEPIPIRPGSGGKPVNGHEDPIRLGTGPTGHPDDGSSAGSPPRIGVDNPQSQPGKIETVEESLSLITDLLEPFAPDAPETTTTIATGGSDAIDLSKPLLPQLNMTEEQRTGSVTCLRTCLSPLDTLDSASACTSLTKGSLESATCVCMLDGVAAMIESCYTECLPPTVALPTDAKPSVRCSRVLA